MKAQRNGHCRKQTHTHTHGDTDTRALRPTLWSHLSVLCIENNNQTFTHEMHNEKTKIEGKKGKQLCLVPTHQPHSPLPPHST